VDIGCFSEAKILHVDSLMIEASIEAAKQARKFGMTVVMDAGTARQGSLELIKLVDVLIASESFAPTLLGEETSLYNTLEALKGLGPSQVVITLGNNGSIGLGDQEPVRQEAFPVKAVDTTGAGDVYHGGYIYGLLQGWDIARCMRFASATAALKCTKIGAQSGIPTLEIVQKFLEKNTTVP
jgi:ribokinase